MHFAGTLPSPNGRERIASTRCYAPASGEYNSRAYAAMPDRPMTHRGSISSAKPPFGYARGSMLVPTVPRQSLSARCGGAYLGALARAIRWVRGALTHGLPGARGPSAAGSQPARAWSRLGRGRGAMPSAAGDTGFRANCAARAPMNPFTPTFSRCGTDIEFICYATNK